MGFTTGFIAGTTLTAATLYLTTSLHRANRLQQAALLRQQSLVLNGIVDPAAAEVPRAPTVREEKAGIAETAKDRWNREVEGLVHRVQEFDWAGAREGLEERVARVVARVREEGRGER